MLAETVGDLQSRGVAQESEGCMCVFLEVSAEHAGLAGAHVCFPKGET